MSNDTTKAGRAPGTTVTPAPGFRNSLRTRLRISAFIGIAILGAWLAYTVNAVLSLYDVTLTIQRTTDLRERVQDAQGGLSDAEEALDRYTSSGQGFDLSRHNAGRTALHMALGAISRRALTESVRGLVQRAEAAEQIYDRAADAAIAAYRPEQPAAAKAQRDNVGAPTAEELRGGLVELQSRCLRTEALADERLKESRDAAATAIIALAALILAGLLWLLTHVNRRILVPCAAASKALEDLAEDRTPPRLFDQTKDEIGELGRNFNRAAALHAERSRALAERDIQASVNAVLGAAATVNDLAGFGTNVLQEIIQVSGAACAVLYLPESGGQFTPAIARGGAEADSPIGREEARRAGRERRPIFLSVDPQTPTVNLYDGRILPRESVNTPLVYFDHRVRFLASLSHELRTPMTVILGFTGALLRGGQGELNAQQKESLERVQRNARMLLGLINDVLDISKIEAGKMEITRQRIDVAVLLTQVRNDFSETANRKGLKLTTEVAPGLEPVTSDPDRLTQIFANLVGNAMKFTDKGFILVRAEPRAEDRWALIVADTGIGIPEEEQETIFEEFRQGEPEEHRGRGGTGLGLAIVRKLVLALGGTISVESARGEGTRFTVLLPRDLPSDRPLELPLEPPALASARDSQRQKTVLIVDDDEGVRELLAFELKPHGLKILQASDGKKGLEVARAEKPDAILLDVLMPNLDGWQTLRALKESPDTRSIPVVIVSVVENRALGISLGSVEHLVKPVDRPALLLALSRAGVLATKGHILVVDDDADVRSLLEQELVAAGYRVRTAAGGVQALELLRRERPSAVLLDLMMPPPDGFEVLYRLRQDPELRELPVIIITARELTASDETILARSALRVIRKGPDSAQLIEEVLRTIAQDGTGREARSA